MADLKTTLEELGWEPDPKVRALLEQKSLSDLLPNQRILFALLVRTFVDLKAANDQWLKTVLKIPLLIVATAALFYLPMAALGYGLTLLSRVTGEWILYLIYLVPLAAVAVGLALKTYKTEDAVRLFETGDEPNRLVDSLWLGRMTGFLNPLMSAAIGIFLGVALAAQVAVLYYTPNHGGLKIEGGFWECVLLTLDNLCHGVFLDTFEMYDIQLHEKVSHSTFSATVFYLFRLGFDALFAVMIYFLYRRFSTRHMLDKFPGERTTPEALTDWINELCHEEKAYPRHYFDEFMFLMLAGYYLQGDYDFIYKVSYQFPRLLIDSKVRYLFVKPDDTLALAFMWDDETANPNQEIVFSSEQPEEDEDEADGDR
jgi:hypothetical protein